MTSMIIVYLQKAFNSIGNDKLFKKYMLLVFRIILLISYIFSKSSIRNKTCFSDPVHNTGCVNDLFLPFFFSHLTYTNNSTVGKERRETDSNSTLPLPAASKTVRHHLNN